MDRCICKKDLLDFNAGSIYFYDRENSLYGYVYRNNGIWESVYFDKLVLDLGFTLIYDFDLYFDDLKELRKKKLEKLNI